MQGVHELVGLITEEVIALRRYFHANPELGGEEVKTQKKVMDELRAIGLSPRKMAKTAVVADLKGASPGKTIAIRADMDGIAVTDECGMPYQSQNLGVSHNCGHDGHMAMLLGAAKILTAMKGDLAGSVRFIFQHSEERFPGGASDLIEEGVLDGIDYIIGTHLWQPLQTGKIGITYDRMMAAPDGFTIAVKGRGGHGSMPHQTVDAMLVGAQIVEALHTIVSRNIDPLETAVVSPGLFTSGEVFNAIPDTAVIKGTVRTFDLTVRTLVFERIESIVKSICEAFGASFTIDKLFCCPPVINNPAAVKVVADAGREFLAEDNVVEIKPVMAGEDFSFFQEKVPGAFIFLGIGSEEKGSIYPHHHPKFVIDEDMLPVGVELMVRSALRLMKIQ